ncbi:hypothetical protein IZU99_09330 [Oscillospiraceae bacterium CM]|nr:hypothetical protein IZU99_09330 [Oscillospiraceae bacterium CM]
MKNHSSLKKVLATAISVATVVMLFAGCKPSGTGTPNASEQPGTSAATLQTFDFSTVMTSFTEGQNKSDNWDRTNIIATDTTTTATIAAPRDETTSVVMLKGNSGKLEATSTTSGTLTTDPTKDSYFASAVLLKDGAPAQYGDGIFKFKMRLSAPQAGELNSAVIFKDAAPFNTLSDDNVTKALAIVTVGGTVQIQRNYTDASGTLVKQDVVKDTGVSLNDGKYHYFILAMQDVSTGTNVKLWIDGNVVYSGVVTGVTGAGAIQLINNSTPMFDKAGNPLIKAGRTEGTFATVTACNETYVGGYDDGPAVSAITLDAVK